MRRLRSLLGVIWLAACAGPPPSAYVGSHLGGDVPLGRISSGEACTEQPDVGGVVIYCGDWKQPSGTVRSGAAASPADLDRLAASGPWRSALDSRLTCAEPVQSSILGGTPAVVLSCTRRIGGWPQVAMVASVRGTAYYADGILPAAPVLERAIGVLSGTVAVADAPRLPQGDAVALAAQRLAAQSFSAGDVGRFHDLMTAGLQANLDESFVAAEQAYRAALDLQRRALGASDPATAAPMMQLALQLSNQGRATEADTLFAEAETLATRARNPTSLARLDYYTALARLNENRPLDALPLLQAADARYTALLPAELLAVAPQAGGEAATVASGRGAPPAFSGNSPLEPTQQVALIGVIETRRYQAITLRTLGREDAARAMIASATALAQARGLHQPNLTARLYRTAGTVQDAYDAAGGGGKGDATDVADMRLAQADFTQAQPGTRPLAQTYLLRAAQAMRAGAAADAVGYCRQAQALFGQLHAGSSAALVAPCLAADAAVAAADPAHDQPVLADMFAASQLVQGSVTSQQIALASARLAAGASNRQVGDAIRRQQDAALALAALERTQEQAPHDASATATASQVAAARATLADADSALQTAAPNYGQLVQQVASAADVLAALRPGEAFVGITFSDGQSANGGGQAGGGWVFLLRDGRIGVAPLGAGSDRIADLVRRVRVSVEPTGTTPPAYATDAAYQLYADTLGRLGGRFGSAGLDGVQALVVAPAGPLLSLPMGLMLTAPTSPDALAAAPWLIRRFAISHVPAAANFVSLRRAGATSAAAPWFGFGDFHNVSLAQAERSFPSAACEDSARLFAGLQPLPYAKRELAAARTLLGGSGDDQLRGASFTAPGVLQQDLRSYRVLHFATHALLPTDLRCQSEPAIVTSPPAGAANAAGALLTASDVMNLQLNAEVVIISACNSAGPDGSPAGESLSGLARSFFYAGARAVMVTHWSINDASSAYLVANTLQHLQADPAAGVAEALRAAQLAILDQAGHALSAEFAHPFYWAPFALVGEGGFHAATGRGAAVAGL